MRKILTLALTIFSLILLKQCHFITNNNTTLSSEEETFLKENFLEFADIEPYHSYKRFIIYDYFALENLRIAHNYSYLETINYFYLNDLSIAPFLNTTITLVNKQFYLKENFIPPLVKASDYPILTTKNNIYLRKEVILAYLTMVEDLQLNNLFLFSGYRSYLRQQEIYLSKMDDDYIAQPGFSEHQTGLAIDVSSLEHGLTNNFQFTDEYQILLANCAKFGFIIRYPENKKNITKYNFEPWHFRYVGKVAATYIMDHQITLEEYLFLNYEL